MTQRKYIDRGGQEYLRIQPKDSSDVFGISRTQFYNDSAEGQWAKEPGPKASVFYLVPRAYAEQRFREMEELNPTVQQQSNPPESSELPAQTPLESSEQDTLPEVYRLLLDEKDKRIADLEARNEQLLAAIEHERRLTERVISSKEAEANSYKGMLMLQTRQTEEGSRPGSQTVDYAPVSQRSLLDRLKFWKP